MKSLTAVFAVLASAPLIAHAQSEPMKLACGGASKSQGYPYGIQGIGETKYRIVDEGQQISILRLGLKDQNFCPAGAVCAVVVTDDLVQLRVSQVPNADPLYTERLRLNRRSLAFEASGGGLDGGWSIAGTCKPERP